MTGPALRGMKTADRTAACLVSLAYLDGIGPATLRRCHLEHGAEETWSDLLAGRPERIVPIATQAARSKAGFTERLVAQARLRDPAADLARQLDAGRQVLVHGRRGYPQRLLADPAAPALLFAEGDLGALLSPGVALVGTRNATLAGRSLAEEMGADLARCGIAVRSGLALGIDGAAHRGALRAGSAPAVAVIASGLDIAYPRRHLHLQRDLARSGLVISETPAGVRPDPWRFPARNRILAALADLVVVVESRVAGGSLLTVDEALARGVPVAAVPGHPSAPASAGTNALLYDGASLVRDAPDVLMILGITPPVTATEDRALLAAQPLDPARRAVLDVLGPTPSSLAEVVAETGRTVAEVSHALAGLLADGLVQESQGWYEPSPHIRAAR